MPSSVNNGQQTKDIIILYNLHSLHPELAKAGDKEMKVLLSSLSVLLWDSINQLPLCKHTTSWPVELMEALLGYLNTRQEQLSSSRVRNIDTISVPFRCQS